MGQAMGMAETPAPLLTVPPVLLTSSPPGLRLLLHQSQEQWRVWPHPWSVWTLMGPSITGQRQRRAGSRASVLKPPPSAVWPQATRCHLGVSASSSVVLGKCPPDGLDIRLKLVAGVPARVAGLFHRGCPGGFLPRGWGGKWRGEPQCRRRIDSVQSEAGWWPQPGAQGLGELGELRACVVLAPSGSLGWPGSCSGRGMGALTQQPECLAAGRRKLPDLLPQHLHPDLQSQRCSRRTPGRGFLGHVSTGTTVI